MPVKPGTHKPRKPNCKRHEVVGEHESKTRKDTTNAGGYGYKWQLASKAYLKANPLCVECESKGKITLATEVHHSVPHRGDMALFWDKSRWVSICKSCHSRLTARGL